MFQRLRWFGAALLIAPCAFAPPGAAAQSAQIAHFVGVYTAKQPEKCAPLITLTLAAHGIARLRNECSVSSHNRAAGHWFEEEGTWGVGGPLAIVHLTSMTRSDSATAPRIYRKEDISLSFSLRRCKLSLKLDPSNEFGKNGIDLAKQDC